MNLNQVNNQVVESQPVEFVQNSSFNKLEEIINYHDNGNIRCRTTILNKQLHGKYDEWYEKWTEKD